MKTDKKDALEPQNVKGVVVSFKYRIEIRIKVPV